MPLPASSVRWTREASAEVCSLKAMPRGRRNGTGGTQGARRVHRRSVTMIGILRVRSTLAGTECREASPGLRFWVRNPGKEEKSRIAFGNSAPSWSVTIHCSHRGWFRDHPKREGQEDIRRRA